MGASVSEFKSKHTLPSHRWASSIAVTHGPRSLRSAVLIPRASSQRSPRSIPRSQSWCAIRLPWRGRPTAF